jgi:hypothetical protein
MSYSRVRYFHPLALRRLIGCLYLKDVYVVGWISDLLLFYFK